MTGDRIQPFWIKGPRDIGIYGRLYRNYRQHHLVGQDGVFTMTFHRDQIAVAAGNDQAIVKWIHSQPVNIDMSAG